MGHRPLFVAFGIPVAVDPFFIFGALLVGSWAPNGFAVHYVVAMVAFTVIHEFGHALTAKSLGSEPAIVITFLGGYASYAPTAKMTTRHEVMVSVMGPVTQLLVALPVGYWAFERFVGASTVEEYRSALGVFSAVMWAGIFLAFLNLLPFWPLDGGHIVSRVAQRVLGVRVAGTVARISFGLGLLMLVAYMARRNTPDGAIWSQLDGTVTLGGNDPSFVRAVWAEIRSFPGFVFGQTLFLPLIVLLGSYGQMQQARFAEARVRIDNAPSTRVLRHEEAVRTAREAERQGWSSGEFGAYPRGWSPSPWLRAHREMLAGDQQGAAHELAALADSDHRDWLVDRPERREIGHLLELVPASAANSLAVLEARVYHGTAEDLVAAATDRYLAEGSAEPLYLGAAGLATRGHDDEAMQWLARAVRVAPDPHRMATDPPFRSLHGRSDYQQLLGEAQRAAGQA